MKKLLILAAAICYTTVTFGADVTLVFTNQMGPDISIYQMATPTDTIAIDGGIAGLGPIPVGGPASGIFTDTGGAWYFRAGIDGYESPTFTITSASDGDVYYCWTLDDNTVHISSTPLSIPEPEFKTSFWAGFGVGVLFFGFKWQKNIAMKSFGGYGDV